MGMNLDGPLYLQRKGLLTPERNKILDVGPQNVYFARDKQIREFVASQGQTVSDTNLEKEIQRLIYFSTPRPEERTTLFSEIADLGPIKRVLNLPVRTRQQYKRLINRRDRWKRSPAGLWR